MTTQSHQAKERADRAHQFSKEQRLHAAKLIACAKGLLQRHGFPAASRRTTLAAKFRDRASTLQALRKSLNDLESVRMTASDDQVLQRLKDEIRETLARALSTAHMSHIR